jgi:lipooligosaccharide transport system permease protein
LVSPSPAIGGVTYLQFIGPGLLAATAMQIGAGESTYPVMSSFKWVRVYHAMAATPLMPLDILVGHLLWIATRIAMATGAYLAVVAAFGGIKSPLGLLAFPVCIVIGLAFVGPIVAYSATRETDNGFAALMRFGIVPMFLFSGTFFPISQLPELLRWVAYATPLWHGVELARSLTLGHVEVFAALGHLAYLAVWASVGIAIAARIFRRKLGM